MGHYLEGHSTSPTVMIPPTRAFHQTARSGAHGFRSHRLRSLLMLCKYCRIRVRCLNVSVGITTKSRLLRWSGRIPQQDRRGRYFIPIFSKNPDFSKALTKELSKNSLGSAFLAFGNSFSSI